MTSIRRLLMTNRYVCDVLKEMRECLKTNNFSYLDGLIEETQVLVNRMESKLHDYKDAKYDEDRIKKLKLEKKKLQKEVDELELKKELLDE